MTRALLLEAMAASGEPINESAVPMDRLDGVTEAFLVSTGRHVQPIRRLGERALRSCPGPLTAGAATVWHAAYAHAIDP